VGTSDCEYVDEVSAVTVPDAVDEVTEGTADDDDDEALADSDVCAIAMPAQREASTTLFGRCIL
jgi:hypothetical protein